MHTLLNSFEGTVTDKKWSYQQITEAAESRIRSLMEHVTEATPDYQRSLHQQWAYGVFMGWQSLTMGWQQDGDSDRLEALTTRQAG